jgi:hypothetical protein
MAKLKKTTTEVSSDGAKISSKTFDLKRFKKSKYLAGASVKFKPQEWIPVSEALQDILSLPGIPHGHITLIRGHSDTGKTTNLLELAVSAQKKGIMPVLIITEMKWNWEHAIQMGLEVDEVVDENTGEIVDYDGFFIYADRGNLNTIEDVASFILDLLDEQKKGNLPYDLCFLWDSIGSVPCEMSIKSNKNSNEWNAGAMSVQFGGQVNQRILLSRKESYPYTNSLVAINKIWTLKPATPMEMPKMKNKGGETMFFDATLIITYGNITNSGTSKINATKDGKKVEFAKRTKVQVEKNHINGVTTTGRIVMTPHGFIQDDPKAINTYKNEHSHEWLKVLGGDMSSIEIVMEGEMSEDIQSTPEEMFDNE